MPPFAAIPAPRPSFAARLGAYAFDLAEAAAIIAFLAMIAVVAIPGGA